MVQPLFDPDDLRRHVQKRMREQRAQHGTGPEGDLRQLLDEVAAIVSAMRQERGLAGDAPVPVVIDTAAATAALLRPHLGYLRYRAVAASIEFAPIAAAVPATTCVGSIGGQRCELLVALAAT